MSEHVLVTGISGFIRKHVASPFPMEPPPVRRSSVASVHTLILAPCILMSAGVVGAQEPDPKDDLEAFAFLVGEWEGELEYLDYGDNSTQVRLPTVLTCARDSTGQALRLEFAYREPDGRTVIGTEELRLLDEPGWVSLGDPWRIDEQSADSEAKAYRIVLSRQGEDNDRAADIRNTILRTDDELTIRKEVRYEGTATYFQRHQYRFRRSRSAPRSGETPQAPRPNAR